MASDNLGIPAVSASQTQKEATINDGINALDKAANGVLPITITTHRTLTTTEFTRNVMFNLSGSPAADFNLVVPGTNRLFAVRNGTAKVCTVKYAASGSLTLAAGVSALVHSDGTDLVSLGGGGGGGGAATLLDLTDGPGTYAGAATYKVVVNGAGTGFEFVPDTGGGGGGEDVFARAGATRFIVLGTFNDSADAGGTALRNVVVSDADGRGAVGAALSVASMTGINKFSSYFEFNMDTLPTATIKLLDFEGNSSGDAYMYMSLTNAGALQIYRDAAYSSTANSANGVIVAATHHKVVVSFDASSVGGAIQVHVDGTLVINSTATGTTSTGSTQNYTIGKVTSSLQGTDNWYSRLAFWSTNLATSDAAALSVNGDIAAYSTSDLRQFWPLDETSGNALPDIGTGNLVLTNFATWGTASAFSPASVGDAVRVGSSGAGDFTGHDNEIAVLLDTGWEFVPQREGLQCYDQTANTTTLWNGSAWV